MGFFKEAEQVVAPVLAPPTLEQRADRADRRAKVAIDAFILAAVDLEDAAAELDVIAVEAFEEAARLTQQGEAAEEAAARHLARADRIRDLIA